MRHCRTRTGSKRWSSSWLISSAENGFGLGRDPEGSVIHIATGATGDLAKLGRRQLAEGEAVEFPGRGEGDMVKIHVEAHADRVGRHHMIDVTRLKQRHLGIAGAWRQGLKHDCGSAALASDQLGHGVDHLGRNDEEERRGRRVSRPE